MLHENLRLKRKERGLSQEELASRLHVVRQTISKWEKGQSVPDAEPLIKLAVILETTVSELLGTQAEGKEEPNQLAKELSRINTQLAIRNHRTRRVLKIIAVALLGLGWEWGVGGLLRRCGSGLGCRGCANGVGVDQANVECADIVEPTAIILVSINVERNIDLLA